MIFFLLKKREQKLCIIKLGEKKGRRALCSSGRGLGPCWNKHQPSPIDVRQQRRRERERYSPAIITTMQHYSSMYALVVLPYWPPLISIRISALSHSTATLSSSSTPPFFCFPLVASYSFFSLLFLLNFFYIFIFSVFFLFLVLKNSCLFSFSSTFFIILLSSYIALPCL